MLRRSSIAIVLLAAGVADANVGRPTFGGQNAGEPDGLLDVTIEHEELAIDLRPIEQHDGRVQVSAVYHLDNRNDAKQLDLVFASGASELVDFRVTLDRQPVAARLVTGGTLPPSWNAPGTTPLPDGGSLSFTLDRDLDHQPRAHFQVAISPGKHVLDISYRADAMRHHAGLPTLARQFAYVLAPARSWARFGGLAVTVHVPAGWTAAIAPTMKRTGDTFEATYASVPADAIGITTYAPSGWYQRVRIVGYALLLVVTFAGGWLVSRTAYRRERRRAAVGKVGAPALAALGLAALWSALVATTGALAIAAPYWTLPAGQADHYGYGDEFGSLLLIVLAIIVFVIGLVLGFGAGHRGHAAGVPAPTLQT